MRRLAVIVACLALAGCWASHERPADADTRRDAGAPDAGPAQMPDAGAPDAGPPPPPREPRWVPLADEGAPPPRLNHLAVYDAAADRLIVFGGFDPYGDLGRCCLTPYIEHRDVWALSLADERWEQLGDVDRTLLAVMPSEVAFDAPRNRLVFIAQTSFDGGPSELLAMDLDTLRLTELPRGPWPGRSAPLRVAWDRTNASLLAHDAIYVDVTPGAWRFDLATDRWTSVPTEERPETRYHNPLVVGSDGSATMYAGFGHAGETDAELWRLDATTGRWTQVPLSPPQPGRWSFRALFEPVRATLVVFGGQRLTVPQGTVLIDPRTGEAVPLTLDPEPVGRRDFSMVLDTRRRNALVFGGAVASTRALGDAWALELP